MINGSIFHLPLADKSVHCIIFSPPYYGLRDYGLKPIVISGELDCYHYWGNEGQKIKRKESPGVRAKQKIDITTGSFCLNCNAWRGSLGLEPTPELFIEHCRLYAKECWRVLRDDGTMWVNIGGSYSSNVYSGYKPKDLIPTPWLFAIALQQDGWYLRSEIIWHKSNPMPESVIDRPTRAHEYVFLFSKSSRYFYDTDAVREEQTGNMHSRGYGDGGPKSQSANEKLMRGNVRWARGTRAVHVPGGRNLRSVWTISSQGFSDAHFATFPPKLIEPMIKAGTSEYGVCVECGAQFERVTEKNLMPASPKANKQESYHARDLEGHKTNNQGSNRARDGHLGGHINQIHILGFRPTCKHYSHLEHDRTDPQWVAPLNWPIAKPIVLDPFGGAGTTQLVATNLSRRGVSIELSFEYCQMAMRRLKSKGKKPSRRLIKLIEMGQSQMFEEYRIKVEGDNSKTLDQMKIEQLELFKE